MSSSVPRVAVSLAITGQGCPAGCKRPVKASLPPNTVDQRVDWAAVLSGDLTSGQEFEFFVYDPTSGVSRVTGLVGFLEHAHVPAGTFEAVRIVYQMEKAGVTEHFQMLATQAAPHIMLR
jgi:hypothetical protein